MNESTLLKQVLTRVHNVQMNGRPRNAWEWTLLWSHRPRCVKR